MLRTEKAKKVFTSLRANTYTLHSFLKVECNGTFFCECNDFFVNNLSIAIYGIDGMKKIIRAMEARLR